MQKLALSICSVFLIASGSAAKVSPFPPDESKMRGAWVGFTSEANDFYRMLLTTNGGYFASSFVGAEPKVYRIDSWVIDSRGKLKIQVLPISTNAYPIVIEGKAAPSRIQLRITGGDKGWAHEVFLYKEEVIDQRIHALRKSMIPP